MIKKTFEKVVKQVVQGQPSVLNFSGFVADPSKKYASLNLTDEKWDRLVLRSEADRKISILDYPAIQAEIAALETRKVLASANNDLIDFSTLKQIQPSLEKLQSQLTENKTDIADTKILFSDASFALSHCMKHNNFVDAEIWDKYLKAAKNVLSDVTEKERTSNMPRKNGK